MTTQSSSEADDHPPLVLAMPRRDLFRVNGFTRRVDMDILFSLAEDSWYAMQSSLENNFDAKEVRLGVVVTRQHNGEQFLIDDHGVALHATAIPPEAGELGPGLVALRRLALVAGRTMMGVDQASVELVGYCNEDSLPECRPYFLLIYRLLVPESAATPAGMTWVTREHLPQTPLDPVSTLVMAGW